MIADIFLAPEGISGDGKAFYTLPSTTKYKVSTCMYPLLRSRSFSVWKNEESPDESYYDNLIDESLYVINCVTFYCDSVPWDGSINTMDKSGEGTQENPWRNITFAIEQMNLIAKVMDCCYYCLIVTGTVTQLYNDSTPYSVNNRTVFLDFTDAIISCTSYFSYANIKKSIWINPRFEKSKDIRLYNAKMYGLVVKSTPNFMCENCRMRNVTTEDTYMYLENCILEDCKGTDTDTDTYSNIRLVSGIISKAENIVYRPDNYDGKPIIANKISSRGVYLCGYVYFSTFTVGADDIGSEYKGELEGGSYVYNSSIYCSIENVTATFNHYMYFGLHTYSIHDSITYMKSCTVSIVIENVKLGIDIDKYPDAKPCIYAYACFASYGYGIDELADGTVVFNDCTFTASINNKIPHIGYTEAGVVYEANRDYIVATQCTVTPKTDSGVTENLLDPDEWAYL